MTRWFEGIVIGTLLIASFGCENVGNSRMINQTDSLSERDRVSLVAAANSGDASAAYRLASYYDFFVRDTVQGTHWLRVASQLGHSEAQYALGTRLRMSKDPAQGAEGLQWLQKAAIAGHKRAQERLERITGDQFPQF